MKKVLIGICLLAGCGDTAGTPIFGDNASEGIFKEEVGEFAGAGGAGGDDETAGCKVDADCEEGFICKLYSGNCLPEPRLCVPGEVMVELDLGIITDRNGVEYPHGDIDPIDVSSNDHHRSGNKGHPITLGGFHYPMREDDAVAVGLTFHVVNFELGEFEVDFGGEMAASFNFDCVFTTGDLVEGAGVVECEQEQGYVLTVTYDVDQEHCE